jgi:hypothetical protein
MARPARAPDIEENRARLQFFQEHLEYNADDSAALRYLQERHKQFLEGGVNSLRRKIWSLLEA